MSVATEQNGYRLVADIDQIDIKAAHAYLSASYWAEAIPLETLTRGIRHSVCFAVFSGAEQVAFARCISDRATFAYVCDVYVLEAHRGKGLSKWIMEAMMAHPELQGLKRWVLVTKDAHTLYSRFGFKPLSTPDLYMEINRMGIYKNPEAFR